MFSFDSCLMKMIYLFVNGDQSYLAYNENCSTLTASLLNHVSKFAEISAAGPNVESKRIINSIIERNHRFPIQSGIKRVNVYGSPTIGWSLDIHEIDN